jgi:replicative DNA helicase
MQPTPKIHGPSGLEIELVGGVDRPHSPSGERMLIASVLADATPGSWAVACQVGIRAKAFYVPQYREAWQALNALHARGVAGVEVLHLREELVQHGKFEEIGGDALLVEVSSFVPQGVTRFLAEQVKLLWDRRGMIELAAEMRECALNFEGREAFVGTAADIGERLVRLGRVNAVQTLAEQIEIVKEDVTARAENRVDKSRWFSSGLGLFDEKCHPFTGGREDQLVAVCGGSGDGKSVLLRQWGGEALKQGKRVLSFSRETSTAGFIEMLVASWMEIDLLHPYLWKENLPAFRAECDRIRDEWADKRLFCIEPTPATPLSDIEDLRFQVNQFVNLRGQPDVILVDYWQLFGTKKRLASNSDKCEHVSHELQACVRELPGTTMFVAAQLNEEGLAAMREIRRDANEKVIHTMPHRGMIRHSQALYHDADRVEFIYRPPVDCRDQDQRSPAILQPEAWVVQDKRRRGGVSYVRCWFQKRFTRFVEIERHEHDEADSRDAVNNGVVPPGGVNKAEWKKARRAKQ